MVHYLSSFSKSFNEFYVKIRAKSPFTGGSPLPILRPRRSLRRTARSLKRSSQRASQGCRLVAKLAGNQGTRALTRENRGAKMIGLRALSGARVYRREPVSPNAGMAG